MGTTYSIKYVPSDKTPAFAEVKSKIENRLVEINRSMSTYDKTSELSLINQSSSLEWHELSQDLYTVLKESKRIEQLGHGTFDITVGPAVNLWGFGPDGERKIPNATEIESARKRIGGKFYQVDLEKPRVKKSIPNLYLDLSAVAKGYGVDAIGLLLESLSVEHSMVEIGGEVRARGHRPDHQAWKIAIDSPFADKPQHYPRVLSLMNKSVATSGNYRNFFMSSGKLFSHTIDPKTAMPVSHQLISVSVIDDQCMTADALATALMVMGPKIGREFVEQERLAAFFIYQQDQQIKTYSSEKFIQLFGKEEK